MHQTTDANSADSAAAEERAKWLRLVGEAPPTRDVEYASCQALERGMVFYPSRITACCTRHSDGTRGEPILAMYSGGPLPIKEISLERKRIIENHKAGKLHRECAACPSLITRKWETGTWLIDMITMAFYTHCNLKCPYCFTVREPWLLVKPKDNYKVKPVLEQMIEDGILAPYAEIRFSGGEPTMLKEFPGIVETITAHGCLARVYTNAVLRSDAIVAALGKGRASLVLGIDAGTREAYIRVKGMDEVEDVWKNAAEYAGIDAENVWAKMIVRYDNTTDVDAFVARCVAAGIQRVYYDMDMYACEKPEHMDEVIAAVARLRLLCATHGIEAACGEAGTNSLDELGVKDRIEGEMLEMARRDDDGRAFLALRDLQIRHGVDGLVYERVARSMGGECLTQLRKVFAESQAAAGEVAAK